MAYKDPLDPRYRAARRRHYHANKEQYLERNRQAQEARYEYLIDLKERTPCTDCGQSFPHYVMEFDHRDSNEKDGCVGLFTRQSWKKLHEEIAKCDIVCANCHKTRTHLRRSLWSVQASNT